MAPRRPFDPGRIRVPPGERAAPNDVNTPLTPHAVNELVRGAISQHIPSTLHVLGEIGDLRQPQSGHLYFTLKDDASELRAVMWRSAAAKLKFDPQPGMEVIATGGLEVYTPRGTYQLIARKLEPRGIGALELAFRQLREKLEAEGLLDPARRKPIPRFPQRIAVITSPTGAAIRDILQTLHRRYRALEILVFPVRVQGETAAGEIAQAIASVNRVSARLGGIDVAIVGRGGGSLEDLWAFNEEVVARAIVASRIPIVSAVGHEVDVSISDLVADLRAATPTAAAELITPRSDDLLSAIGQLAGRARRCVAHALELARSELDTLLAYDGLARPLARLRQHGQLLDERQQRVYLALFEHLRAARERLTASEMALLRFASAARFAETAQTLEHRLRNVRDALDARLRRSDRRLQSCLRALPNLLPHRRLGRAEERLTQMQRRMQRAAHQTLAACCTRLDGQLQRLTLCDPKHILARGYSITRDAKTRRIIRSINEIRENTRVITQVADGEFRSNAEDPQQPRLFD